MQADLLNGQINRRRRRRRKGSKLNYQPHGKKPADPDQIASKAAVAARAGRVSLATLMASSGRTLELITDRVVVAGFA